MRCPDCQKFVSFDDSAEPELDLESDGATVTGTVRITLTCVECGTELKEATFDVEVDLNLPADLVGSSKVAKADLHSYIADESATLTSRTEGKGRGLRTFYGAEVEGVVKVKIGDKAWQIPFTWSDDIQASSMDEMC